MNRLFGVVLSCLSCLLPAAVMAAGPSFDVWYIAVEWEFEGDEMGRCRTYLDMVNYGTIGDHVAVWNTSGNSPANNQWQAGTNYKVHWPDQAYTLEVEFDGDMDVDTQFGVKHIDIHMMDTDDDGTVSHATAAAEKFHQGGIFYEPGEASVGTDANFGEILQGDAEEVTVGGVQHLFLEWRCRTFNTVDTPTPKFWQTRVKVRTFDSSQAEIGSAQLVGIVDFWADGEYAYQGSGDSLVDGDIGGALDDVEDVDYVKFVYEGQSNFEGWNELDETDFIEVDH